MTCFQSLPREIRQEIWLLALPGPRVLHIKQRAGSPTIISRTGCITANPTTSPASYGGHHPSVLSVNRESRTEALRVLTPLFGAYWNLDIDAAYFELPEGDNSRNEVLLMAEMRKAGLLDVFKHIAIDLMIWNWRAATYTMEFRVTFGVAVHNAYEHPIQTLNSLPNLKTCAFILFDHTLQKDITTPYACWHLGPLTKKTTFPDLNMGVTEMEAAEKGARQQIDARRGEIKTIDRLKVNLLAIHGREREDLPSDRLRRGLQGWEMDWFG